MVEALELFLSEKEAVLVLPTARHAPAEVRPEIVAASLAAGDPPPRRDSRRFFSISSPSVIGPFWAADGEESGSGFWAVESRWNEDDLGRIGP